MRKVLQVPTLCLAIGEGFALQTCEWCCLCFWSLNMYLYCELSVWGSSSQLNSWSLSLHKHTHCEIEHVRTFLVANPKWIS